MSRVIRLLSAEGKIPGHPRPEDAYFDHALRVPDGISRLTVTLQYHRDRPEWDVLLLVFDPEGHRGTVNLKAASGGPVGDVVLTKEIAAGGEPGCQARRLRSGDWIVQLWAAHVNDALPYSLHVDAVEGDEQPSARPLVPESEPTQGRVVRHQPGWYRGELHTHTTASDGHITPAGLLAEAKRTGLDFLAITDHNSIGAWPELFTAQDLCVIPALEVTMPDGHANLFGLRRWLDWRVDYQGRTMADVIADARAQDAVISINHPFAPGYSWHFDVPLALVDCIEVINYPVWWPASTEFNLMALGLWTSLLNAGHRITAVGGSDVFHLPPGETWEGSPIYEALASPATCVYADSLSSDSILEGLRHRRAYVTMGPEVRLAARAQGMCYEIGDTIPYDAGEIDFLADIRGAAEGSVLHWVRNGEVLSEQLLQNSTAHYRFPDTPDWSASNWYRIDLYNPAGEPCAITNPIYAGLVAPPPIETWSTALARAHGEGAIIEQTIFE